MEALPRASSWIKAVHIFRCVRDVWAKEGKGTPNFAPRFGGPG